MGLMNGFERDEVARIIEQVAVEGLDHPRDLDVAIDAITDAFRDNISTILAPLIEKGGVEGEIAALIASDLGVGRVLG